MSEAEIANAIRTVNREERKRRSKAAVLTVVGMAAFIAAVLAFFAVNHYNSPEAKRQRILDAR